MYDAITNTFFWDKKTDEIMKVRLYAWSISHMSKCVKNGRRKPIILSIWYTFANITELKYYEQKTNIIWKLLSQTFLAGPVCSDDKYKLIYGW